MNSLRSAAATFWNTPILRVPVGLAAVCLLTYRNSHLFAPIVPYVRSKRGNVATDRMIHTMFGICCILVTSDIMTAAAETYNARIK